MPGNGALVFMLRPQSAEIRYYARVSVLENQKSCSYIICLFPRCVNVLRLGCNTRLRAASRGKGRTRCEARLNRRAKRRRKRKRRRSNNNGTRRVKSGRRFASPLGGNRRRTYDFT